MDMPKCTSCNREISQEGGAVSFPCPDCEEHVIWRCGKCRSLSNEYECPECGFTGP
ncbi:MAG: zinc finger domain-containing protein [Candidatus Hadarchaeota archaeon]